MGHAYQSADDVRRSARKAWHSTQDALSAVGQQAYASSRDFARRGQEYYNKRFPQGLAHDRQVEKARSALQNWSEKSSRCMHRAEHWTVGVALSYLLYKLFSARKTELREVESSVRTHIHEKPVESAIIALSVGYLLGKILR